MTKNIFLFGIAALSICACTSIEDETLTEYSNPGVNAGIKPMPTGGNQMEDYYIDVTAWDMRGQWNLANIHDPSIIRADDGYYYMYQTDASYGGVNAGEGDFRGHFYCRRSKDLVNWQWMGPTMRHIPSWVGDSVNSIRKQLGLEESEIDFASGDPDDMGYWAPCIRKVTVNGQTLYRLYYSLNMPSVDDEGTITAKNLSPNMMGLMESTNPADLSSWVDKGFVITQYSDKGKSPIGKGVYGDYYYFNVIDPTYIQIPDDATDGHAGEHWLIYGSWHSGFAAVQVDPETGKPFDEVNVPWAAKANFGKRIYTRTATHNTSQVCPRNGTRWQASEGPDIIYRNGYYYLFVANNELGYDDDIKAKHAPYCTTVVRSKSITGPYADITGVNFTSASNGTCAYPIVTFPYQFSDGDHDWEGISHCTVFDDGNDNWYYCSQQRFQRGYKGNVNSGILMLGGVRSIVWVDSPRDGTPWPLALPERYAGVEQTAIEESELVGNWLHIDMIYNNEIYNNGGINTSVNISLNIDGNGNHTVSGTPFDGQTWSYDSSKNIITVGSGSNEIKLYLRREQDWEMAAGSRTNTIVYVGLSTNCKTTYWGKKVK